MQRTYAKLAEGQLITTCALEDDLDLINQITADGFKLYDEDAGQPEVGPLQRLSPVYQEQADRITLWWEIEDNDPEMINREISLLQEQIAATDYQVVKSFEYALAGIQPPYDAVVLHTEREDLRNQIRELEQRLLPVDDEFKVPEGYIPKIKDSEVKPRLNDGGDVPVGRI